MLRVELSRADTEALEIRERLHLPAGSGGEDVVSTGEMGLEGLIEKGERGYLLQATARGEATLRCVRCLKEFPFSFAEKVELELLPTTLAPTEEEIRLNPRDLDVRFFEEGVLDLVELVAEQLQLAVPMKPLCDESCRGLCPHCGADLNRGLCACPRNRDERWGPLQHWRPGR